MTISPEGLDIAHAYLQNGSDVAKTAEALNLPIETVHKYLSKREVTSYIDRVFNEAGFRNRDRLAAVWDEIIAAKLEEMEATGMGSSKDIVEILEKAHKFAMDQMKMQIELIKAQKEGGPSIQINTQTNNYNTLLEKIANVSK
jgi:DNA-binding MarR family transcriptional regulator